MAIANKLQTIAENEQKVYGKGYEQGSALKDQKPYINSSKIVSMRQFFYGITPTPNSLDLLDTMDTSNAVNWYETFRLNPNVVDIEVDTSSATSIASMFYGCNNAIRIIINSAKASGNYVFCECKKLTTLGELDYSSKTSNTNDFKNCVALENITFAEQSIIVDISFAWSNLLSLASLKSILLGLKNYAGTSNELAYTVSLHEDSWTLLNNDGATSPNGNTWAEYVVDKGWNA